MAIDFRDELFKRNMPKAFKILNDLPNGDADEVINLIIDIIIKEVRCGLGLEDCDDDLELQFFQMIHEQYKEFYGGCYFCDSEIDFDEHSLHEKAEFCIVCMRKLRLLFKAFPNLSTYFTQDQNWKNLMKKIGDRLFDELFEDELKHFDREEVLWYSSLTEFYETFLKAIDEVTSLVHQINKNEQNKTLFRMIHTQIITTLETYLTDAFIGTVLQDENLMRKYLETDPVFKKYKFTLDELYSKQEQIKGIITERLQDVNYHNIRKVKPMYKDTLGIEFGDDLEDIFKAISVRHDCVHRNGKTKDGNELTVDKDSLLELIVNAHYFVENIENQIQKL